MVPSSSLVRGTSRNGSCPPDSFSTVNWMFVLMLLRCSWKSFTKSRGSAAHVSFTYLLQKHVGVWKEDVALSSMSFITRFATTTDTGNPMAVP